MTTTLLLTLAVGVTACGPADDTLAQHTSCLDADEPAESPALVLARSSFDAGDFTPLEGGEAFQLDYGPQGGQHIYLSLRTFGDVPGWEARFSLLAPDGTAAGQAVGNRFDQCPGGWTAVESARVFVDEAQALTGALLQVTATPVDGGGSSIGNSLTESATIDIVP